MKKYEIAIIGGGFSGLTLATMLAKTYKDSLVIIEANKRIGKKILATGNGQGNITNLNLSPEFYHGDVSFAKEVISRYDNFALLNYFENLGLITDSTDGKVYPASFFAGAILDVLRFELERYNVPIFTECKVTKITKTNLFKITCENQTEFLASKVVLAFGGKSGSGFMTDGSSFALAKSFGHSVTSLAPSLVQLKCKRDKLKGLKGIKQEVKVGLYSDKQHIKSYLGDLLFTDYGVSGNSIFSISAYLKGVKNPTLKIEFLPNISTENLTLKLREKCQKGVNYERLLVSCLPSRLILTVLSELNLNASATAEQKQIYQIVHLIKNFTLQVEGTAGFENSQVTAGGITTSEINVNSMQSKLVNGLYVVGEALNVDGDCGGYNLQWAFSSSAIAGEHLLNGKN